MTRPTHSTAPSQPVLSPEAADELVRYLHLLIDKIQFTSYGEQLRQKTSQQASSEVQQTLWDDFDDPITF